MRIIDSNFHCLDRSYVTCTSHEMRNDSAEHEISVFSFISFCENIVLLSAVWMLTCQNENKLRGFMSASELYRLRDCHFSTKFIAKFCG
jgi:hypothetical protein